LEVYGATSPAVARVKLNSDDEWHRASAELLQVTDRDALKSTGIRKRFGYFIGELPSDTAQVTATAVDSRGEPLGSADFESIFVAPSHRAFISGRVR
jgi:hypothetical protein